jgi:hypothetical protein
MKIERGWMYYPTIHHVFLVEQKSSSWVPPAMASTAAYEPSAAILLKGARWQGHEKHPLLSTLLKLSGCGCITQQSTMAII